MSFAYAAAAADAAAADAADAANAAAAAAVAAAAFCRSSALPSSMHFSSITFWNQIQRLLEPNPTAIGINSNGYWI